MSPTQRISPFHSAGLPEVVEWTELQDMRVAAHVVARALERARLAAVAIADASFHRRAGLKGPRAPEWLTEQGVGVPAAANRWYRQADGGMLARLGLTEFLAEDGPAGPGIATHVLSRLGTGETGVYPVLRQDAKVVVAGPRAADLLVQVCAVPLGAPDATDVVTMTEMAGVPVTVLSPGLRAGVPWYEILCDATFAPCLWHALEEVAVDLAGGPVGYAALALPDAGE